MDASRPSSRPSRSTSPDVRDRIRSLDADAWVVIAFGQKLKKKLLDGIFAINLHASLLPRWRGAAPIHHAILAGDEITGNSVISLASRMDAGLVYAQSTRPIEPQLTTGELHDLLAADGPDLVSRVLHQHAAGRLDPVEQDESRVTLAPQLTKADGLVDFGQPADVVLRRIHGLSPWPGAAAYLGSDRLGLHRAEVIETESESPEDAVGRLEADGGIRCATGRIRLLEVQPAGKRRMSFDDFARGHDLEPGDRLRGEPAC
jgi:methionyl-tRNA formyltransferase